MNQQINLYVAELRPRRIIFPAAQMALLAGLVAIALAAYHTLAYLELKSVQVRAEDAETALAAVQQIANDHPHARILICGSLYLAGHILRENG